MKEIVNMPAFSKSFLVNLRMPYLKLITNPSEFYCLSIQHITKFR